jgi:hypothetical protein
MTGHDVNKASKHLFKIMAQHVEIHVDAPTLRLERENALKLVPRQWSLRADNPSKNLFRLRPALLILHLQFRLETLDDILVAIEQSVSCLHSAVFPVIQFLKPDWQHVLATQTQKFLLVILQLKIVYDKPCI